jgi:hypothetical protein
MPLSQPCGSLESVKAPLPGHSTYSLGGEHDGEPWVMCKLGWQPPPAELLQRVLRTLV